MTLVELSERLGPHGQIKLSWSGKDGWILTAVTGDNTVWTTKTQDSDLDMLFERCFQALSAR